MRQATKHARAGPKSEGRPHHKAAPSSIAASDCNHSTENRNSRDAHGRRVILIVEFDPGAFAVEIEGQGRREFASYKSALGFASGQRLVTGLPIDDRTGQ